MIKVIELKKDDLIYIKLNFNDDIPYHVRIRLAENMENKIKSMLPDDVNVLVGITDGMEIGIIRYE